MDINKLAEKLSDVFKARFSRGSFLKFAAVMFGSLALPSVFKRGGTLHAATMLGPRPKKNITTACGLAVANNADPAIATRAAVNTLGGMKLFVKKGDTVVVKPNIGWDRAPELAANTHPAVVETLVRMSFESGAKYVKVFDYTCNNARRTYENSGIAAAARRAGAQVFFIDDWKFFPGKFPAGALMADWPIYRDAVACDCFINVPVAKHHRLTEVTLSIKNLMGICGAGRGDMHQNIAPKLADVLEFIKPELTVIDASRILLRNGPTGGSLADVKKLDTVIASADPVLADAYAATWFGHKPTDIGYILESAARKLGSLDLAAANIRKVSA
jgi:uncharacterized protein (DUF362 family)